MTLIRAALAGAIGLTLVAAGTAGAAARARSDYGSPARSAELTGNLLVLVDRDGGRASIAAASRSVRARLASSGIQPAGHSVPQIGLITVRSPIGVSLAAAARALARVPGVASVQPERRYVPRAQPDDPALSTIDPADGLTYQWYLEAEAFPAAWTLARGTGALVGVIDTGIDAAHPDLAAKIAAAVDQQDPSSARGTARTDEVGHGTHVASIACADTNNGLGIAGAGYGCRLIVEKSDFSDSSIAAAIVDATDRGALALNMSFGPADPTTSGPAPDSEVRALDYAAARRVVLVAAAADSPGTEQGDPANVLQPPGTGPTLGAGIGLDVTAAQYGGQRASFAGSGSEISLAAYGASSSSGDSVLPCTGAPEGVFAAYPGGSTDLEQFPPSACRTTFQGDNRYAYIAGTSMAAPQVAGAGALLRSLNPDAHLSDVLRTIKQTAARPAGQGWSQDLGWGILDAGAAVAAIRRVDRTPPVATLSAPKVSRTRVFLLRWQGRDPARLGLIAAGIAYYALYVRTNGSRPQLIERTAQRSHRFRGQAGRSYTFSVVAVDRAGNHQKQGASAAVRVARGAR